MGCHRSWAFSIHVPRPDRSPDGVYFAAKAVEKGEIFLHFEWQIFYCGLVRLGFCHFYKTPAVLAKTMGKGCKKYILLDMISTKGARVWIDGPKDSSCWWGAVALAAIGVAIWALLFRTPAPPAIPDIAPAVEDNAQPTGEGEDKMPQAQGGGAVNLTYSDQVTLSLGEGTLSLQVTNPARSNQSMLLQVVVQDVVVAQSGTLPPGNRLEALPLSEGSASLPVSMRGGLPSGLPPGREPAQVSTEVPIVLTVL